MPIFRIMQIPVVTRDTKRYRHYFPTVALIAPDAGDL
jgi:hypothetical protein